MHLLSPEFRWLIVSAAPTQLVTRQAQVNRLQELGIRTYAGIEEAISCLTGDRLIAAIGSLSELDKRVVLPTLLRLCESSDPIVRIHSLRSLRDLGGRKAARALVQRLRSDPDVRVREKAAHGLGFLFDERVERLGFKTLLRALNDPQEAVAVRAQAAESLGNHVGWWDRHTRRYRKAEHRLIDALSDPAPELRFWAAFALGSMRSSKARPRLEVLAAVDTAACPGWWAVKDEAGDAIEFIITGNWPQYDRQRSG